MIWVIFSIAIMIILLLVLFVIFKRDKAGPDYYSWYWIGISWFVIGILFGNGMLMVMGLIFMLVSIINRKKWKKNYETRMNRVMKLSRKDKKTRAIILWVLAILVVIGIIAVTIA